LGLGLKIFQEAGLLVVFQIGGRMKFQAPAAMGTFGREIGMRVTAIRAFVQIPQPFGYVSPELDPGGRIQVIKSNRHPFVVFSSCPPPVFQITVPLQIVFQGKEISDFRDRRLAPKEGPAQAKVAESSCSSRIFSVNNDGKLLFDTRKKAHK